MCSKVFASPAKKAILVTRRSKGRDNFMQTVRPKVPCSGKCRNPAPQDCFEARKEVSFGTAAAGVRETFPRIVWDGWGRGKAKRSDSSRKKLASFVVRRSLPSSRRFRFGERKLIQCSTFVPFVFRQIIGEFVWNR